MDKPKKKRTDTRSTLFAGLDFFHSRSTCSGVANMINTPPSLQQFCLKLIIDYEEIVDVLNPEEDWDNDVSHLYNDRLTLAERDEFEFQVVRGIKTLAQVKIEIRALLIQRPFDLDLVQLKLAVPLFVGLPECVARQIWLEANVLEFKRYVPGRLWFVIDWNQIVMSWEILYSVLDGCTNQYLFEVLEEQEQLLIEKDNDELWRVEYGSVWLCDMITIDE